MELNVEEKINKAQQPSTEDQDALKRIDGKYIWEEISSVLNFEKGILFTIKELIIRPGDTIREFLQHDRKRLIKPIVFVIFSSLVFIVAQNVLKFNTGTLDESIGNPGIIKAFEWVGENFGISNIFLGILIGFCLKLFFINSKFNIYEIFILVFFTIGMGNLIYTFFGIVETFTESDTNNLTYLIVLSYSAWAIGNFFNKNKFSSYLKSFFAYALGSILISFITVVIGVAIDILSKNN